MPYKDPEKAKAYHREYQKEYSKRHQKEIREYQRKYHKEYVVTHSDKIRKNRRKQYQKNRRKVLEYQHSRNLELQEERNIIVKSVGKCEICGFDDIRALEIHHIEGNKSKGNYYREITEIIQKRVPYMVACANCHRILHTIQKKMKEEAIELGLINR